MLGCLVQVMCSIAWEVSIELAMYHILYCCSTMVVYTEHCPSLVAWALLSHPRYQRAQPLPSRYQLSVSRKQWHSSFCSVEWRFSLSPSLVHPQCRTVPSRWSTFQYEMGFHWCCNFSQGPFCSSLKTFPFYHAGLGTLLNSNLEEVLYKSL